MRILLLGSDTPVGYSLRAFIPPLKRHELVLLPLEAVRWKRERQVKKLLSSIEPDMVIDARMISLIEGNDPVGQPDIERSRWLGAQVARRDCRYFLLSSSKVFSGQLKRPYREGDIADAVEPTGRALAEIEGTLADQVGPLFILRLGVVFSGRAPGLFHLMLERLRQGKKVYVTDNRRDCPVHAAEVARVIAGVIDQISVGAPTRGLYHYGSEGDTGYYTFAESVIACASQFPEFGDVVNLLVEDTRSPENWFNRSLDCSAIRHQFGIQRRHWREFVERAVRRYIELYCVDNNV